MESKVGHAEKGVKETTPEVNVQEIMINVMS